MTIDQILISPMVGYIVAASMIITQLVKGLNVPSRFYPLVSFVFGVIMTSVVFGISTSSILPAIIVGGAGAGLFDLGKKTVLGK